MVTAGLATFVTVGSVLSERSETAEVVVLLSDGAPGSSLASLPVQPVSVAANAPFLDLMLRPDDVVPGFVLEHEVAAGRPLLRDDLVAAEAPGLSRTVAIELEAVSILGLGLSVGDRVDVIGVDEQQAAVFVLSDVRVARLPQGGGAEGLLGGPSVSFVTLEVDDDQALALMDARQRGPVELLRSTGAPRLPDRSSRASNPVIGADDMEEAS
ncbi:MAG: RcpC/CpaB family pilus assembly protein [Acidimicrobiales bacterium]